LGSSVAGIGVTDQTDIGQKLEFETVMTLFAGATQLVFARSLVNAGGKVLIAAAAAPSLGDDNLLVGGLEIVDQLACILVVKRCAYRNLQRNRVAV
jgi:hypothetical protein